VSDVHYFAVLPGALAQPPCATGYYGARVACMGLFHEFGVIGPYRTCLSNRALTPHMIMRNIAFEDLPGEN